MRKSSLRSDQRSPPRATFAAPDQLLIVTPDGLLARRFDPESARLIGEPRILTDDVSPAVSASDNGVLVYRPPELLPARSQ